MVAEKNYHTLKMRMECLGNALFYNYSTAVLKFPVCVVSMIKLDEVGNLWFTATRPNQCLDTFEKDFPSMLHFYRKGQKFHMKVHGKAVIVDDPEQLFLLDKDILEHVGSETVLLKVRIQKVEYFEEQAQQSFLSNIKTMLHKWLFREQPGYHPYWIGSSDTATSF